ncbi:MAG: MBL fold metallo-hydrolase [Acidobacteriota bacterium]|nr:MBL fold metallo-hydrolase [Acidobacteriota bacterium]
MKTVTVIGSGNAFNTDGRAHPCFLIESAGGERLLLDVGATTLQRLRQDGLALDTIDAAALTHFHGDHFFGLPFLLLAMNFESGRTRPFTVVGPSGVEGVCRAAMELAYPDIEYGFDVVFLEIESSPVGIGGLTIAPLPVTHRRESVGYRVTGPSGKTVAFSGDAAFDDKLLRLIDGVDLAIVELGLLEQSEPPISHVSVGELERARGSLRADRILFTHLTDEIARRIEESRLGIAARDGMVVEV